MGAPGVESENQATNREANIYLQSAYLYSQAGI